jgi:methionyl-tRNA formyltransferase
MTSPRIIFAGTPEFALAALTALVDAEYVPVAVLTQPDRPAGRGKRMTASAVKRYAERQTIEVLQPATLRDDDVVATLGALQADVMIVAAYGLILPQNVLDIPRHGCLNIHASLLPRWRGAAPIQAAILANDRSSGISLMQMTAGLDCGPVYCSHEVCIATDETAGELHDRLAALGGEILCNCLPDILAGDVAAIAQDETFVTYAGKIQKQDAKLDWQLPARELQRKVRAYNPVPGSYFFADDQRVKCWRAQVVKDVNDKPGTVVDFTADSIVIACGEDGLRLDELQLSGKRRAGAREFVQQIKLHGKRLPG